MDKKHAPKKEVVEQRFRAAVRQALATPPTPRKKSKNDKSQTTPAK